MEPVAASPVSPSPSPRVATTGGVLPSSDFETFLRMLTAQLRNQDPLNPLDSNDFAVQLATFSGVEQQVRTNDLLTTLSDRLGVMGLTDLAGWVGMEARTPGQGGFEGVPLALDIDLPHGTLSADLIVTDAGGAEVQRLALDPEAASLTWAGVRADGSPLPPGVYGFRTEARSLDDSLPSGVVGVWGSVREVRTGPDGAELVLSGQRVTTPAGITALRRP